MTQMTIRIMTVMTMMTNHFDWNYTAVNNKNEDDATLKIFETAAMNERLLDQQKEGEDQVTLHQPFPLPSNL